MAFCLKTENLTNLEIKLRLGFIDKKFKVGGGKISSFLMHSLKAAYFSTAGIQVCSFPSGNHGKTGHWGFTHHDEENRFPLTKDRTNCGRLSFTLY